MPEKLEEIMKKIHILLANCEKSPYSSEDVIVPKKRLFALLEQLNYAVYEIMEQYEATVAARDRALIREERMAAEIREDARQRAEDVYAASLLYTEDMLQDMRTITNVMYQKTREAYAELLQSYEERMDYIEKNEQELISQMSAMVDAKSYLHIIEDRRRQKEAALKREAALKQEKARKAAAEKEAALRQQVVSTETVEQKLVEENDTETAVLKETVPEKLEEKKQLLLEEKPIYKIEQREHKKEKPRESVGDISDEEIDEYSAKLAAQLVITVHDRPQVPEGFTKKKDRRAAKMKPELPDEEIEISPDEIEDFEQMPMFSTEDLDREYFDWQESQEQAGEKDERGKSKGLKLLSKRRK